MPITAECSECGRQFEANDAWAGKHFRYPNCGATAAVPIPPGYEHLADPAIPLPPPSYPVRAAEHATARARLLGEFADRSIPAPEKPTRTGVLADAAASLLLSCSAAGWSCWRSPGFAGWRPIRTAVEHGLGRFSAVFSHFRPPTSDLPSRRL